MYEMCASSWREDFYVPSLQSSKEERGERKGNEVHTSTHLLEKFKFNDAFLLCFI